MQQAEPTLISLLYYLIADLALNFYLLLLYNFSESLQLASVYLSESYLSPCRCDFYI